MNCSRTADSVVAVAQIINDEIIFPVCINEVIAATAVDCIFSVVVVNVIVTCAAVNRIVAAFTIESIFAVIAVNQICLFASVETVAAARAVKSVLSFAADNQTANFFGRLISGQFILSDFPCGVRDFEFIVCEFFKGKRTFADSQDNVRALNRNRADIAS